MNDPGQDPLADLVNVLRNILIVKTVGNFFIYEYVFASQGKFTPCWTGQKACSITLMYIRKKNVELQSKHNFVYV